MKFQKKNPHKFKILLFLNKKNLTFSTLSLKVVSLFNAHHTHALSIWFHTLVICCDWQFQLHNRACIRVTIITSNHTSFHYLFWPLDMTKRKLSIAQQEILRNTAFTVWLLPHLVLILLFHYQLSLRIP